MDRVELARSILVAARSCQLAADDTPRHLLLKTIAWSILRLHDVPSFHPNVQLAWMAEKDRLREALAFAFTHFTSKPISCCSRRPWRRRRQTSRRPDAKQVCYSRYILLGTFCLAATTVHADGYPPGQETCRSTTMATTAHGSAFLVKIEATMTGPGQARCFPPRSILSPRSF